MAPESRHPLLADILPEVQRGMLCSAMLSSEVGDWRLPNWRVSQWAPVSQDREVVSESHVARAGSGGRPGAGGVREVVKIRDAGARAHLDSKGREVEFEVLSVLDEP